MITIDLNSSVPLADQIVGALRRAIAEGLVASGQELPTVRQLAEDLGVNFNTVARAYRVLEASGLVRSGRGRGTRVVSVVESDSEGAIRRVVGQLGAALADARLAGLSRAQIEALLGVEIDTFWRSDDRLEKADSR